MILFKKTEDLKKAIKKLKNNNSTIGFVPTMGALHEGHISLIKSSKSKADITVCSIFVNPTQFNNATDFEKYPITLEKDVFLLEQAGCDILFLPSVSEIYPENDDLPKSYDLGFIETILEGEFRPGHFQGVCQVVHRLLEATQCDLLFLGQKDFQQCMVIKKLIQLILSPCKIIINETKRSNDGLALSSRNLRIPATKKQHSLGIYKTLQFIKNDFKEISFEKLIKEAKQKLLDEGFIKVDYISICNTDDLTIETSFEENKSYVCLIAAFLDDIRLIDNLILTD